MKQVFVLRAPPHPSRIRCFKAIDAAPDGVQVTISEIPANSEQKAKFYAICTDLERRGAKWAGKARNKEEWKLLLISAHAIATKQPAEVVSGLEGEFVNLRESIAEMSKSRISSLIDYADMWLGKAQDGNE